MKIAGFNVSEIVGNYIPSPSSIGNKILMGVAIVSGVGLVIVIIYLLTRKRKGKYE